MLSLKSVIRSIKFVSIAFALVIFITTSAAPAFAFGSTSTSPTDGEAHLSEIRSNSETVANANPRSRKEVSSVAKGGLNGVQGVADQEKMIKDAPEATTVKEDIASGIKSIVGQD